MRSAAHIGPTMRHVRDFAIYIAIALGIGLGLIYLAATGVQISGEVFIKWGGLAGNTAILFGYFVADSKAVWQRRCFWALIFGLLCVHTAIFCTILLHVSTWKLLWFLIMYLEFPGFMLIRDKLFGPSGKSS